MKVLVACEFSGVVRDAFTKLGHEAWSCDILPSETKGFHIQDNIMNVICGHRFMDSFDLMIAHPPCTYLCNSGVRWLKDNPERQVKMESASGFFKALLRTNVQMIAVENPIPHKHAALPKYNQIIQPWQFGHGETKATCLWLKNLPKLVPTNIVPGREGKIWKMPPGPDRAKNRSRTYQGIADAMAKQWGSAEMPQPKN